MKILSFFTALLSLFFVAHAQAHALHVFAQYDGQMLSGKAYYSDMTPAAETYLEVQRSGVEEPILASKTDAQGAFNLTVPDIANSTLKGEEGHRATITADRIATSNNKGADLMLLREDIAHLKTQIYLRDILGGIGYIVGIIGLFAWWNARKSKSEIEKERI